MRKANKAFKNQSEKFEERNKNNKKAIEILSAHAEKVSKLSSGRASIEKDAQKELERAKKEVAPENISERLIKASETFMKQYSLKGRDVGISSILQGISVFSM